MITRTHNAYHLGDNLVHLHFLRKVALANPDRQFVHYCDYRYLQTKSIYRVTDVVSDVPNIKLEPIGYANPDSINAWRGDKQFWYSHEHRNDFVKFHTEFWFPYLASMMNVDNPIRTPSDMLFDYPAIHQSIDFPCDANILIINSPPGSGQFSNYNEHALAGVAYGLREKGYDVTVSHRLPADPNNSPLMNTAGLSVTQIGHLSLHCHTILMVSTGPSWPTFNIWNQESVKNRIILLDNELVNLSPNTTHCRTIDEASEVLKGIGLL